MQYEKHDFEKNITGAIQSGEPNKVIEILMKEVGRLLAENKPALISAVVRSGKKIPDSISDKDLVRIITSGVLQRNEKFLNNLITILISENKKHSEDLGGILQGAGSIVGGVSNAIGAGLQASAQKKAATEGTKAAKEATKQAQYAMASTALNAKSATENARTTLEAARLQAESGTKNIMNITLVVGAVAVIGIIGFVIYKRSQGGATAPAPAAQ